MGATELVAMAASISLLAGWRLYAAVLVALANPWIALALITLFLAATAAVLLTFRRFAKDLGNLFLPAKGPDCV
jgi:hypothetical protein